MKALAIIFLPLCAAVAAEISDKVDFRWSPPEWQTAICLPDDPQKSLVDRSGELLYHYGQGGREFATRIGIEVAGNAVWQKQELLSPRVPIVRTFRTADGLEIVEEAFAVTDLLPPAAPPPASLLQRLDSGGTNHNWAKPPAGIDPSLRHIAVHMGGNLRYELAVAAGSSRRVALALCEGWWQQTGKRVQVLRIEGAEPRTVDTVADIGRNQVATFWFDAKDANADGKIEIAVDAAPQAADKNTILNGLWVFAADQKPDSGALLAGKLNTAAQARLGPVKPGGPARNDLILVHVTNTTSEARTLHPRLIVDTTLEFSLQPGAERCLINDHETLTTSPKLVRAVAENGSRRTLELEAMTVPAGKAALISVLYSGGGAIVIEPQAAADALACRDRAAAYWEKAPLPYGRVGVPDAGIQALIDSSIRNIWQAREIKNGMTCFHVGPTIYRSLWVVDGAFLLETATMLGAGNQARDGIHTLLSHQKNDGRIEVMQDKYGYWKENGLVIWACLRHARLTGDKAWFESVWPKLRRVAEFIKVLRTDTPVPCKDKVIPRAPHNDLDRGLMPHGIIDGGIQNGVDYSNTYWNLIGLAACIEGAAWLGKDAEAAAWKKEYDDFNAVFRKAVARDLWKDSNGNTYLPMVMGAPGREQLPQRAQWSFCHAVHPGRLFAKDDPVARGTLSMLRATEQEGMVRGTGWDAKGIWTYFGSFYAHAWLEMGDGKKAAAQLYAFANHAAASLVWREEQSLKGADFHKVGDMPHNWASAEFIRLVVHLLALDRGDELHLLEGVPPEWLKPGMVTRLDKIATPFGPFSMTLQVSADGTKATLTTAPLKNGCHAIVIHSPGGGTTRLDASQNHSTTLPL